jgi:hypothetical protein
MRKGFWNGEPTATFVGVKYRVEKAEIETWWQNRVVGTIRQGLLITYGGETWLIDNEHGDGYYKVTTGMGSPRCGHKSLGNYTLLMGIPDDEINTDYEKEEIDWENRLHDTWLENNHPEVYKRMISLKESLLAHREKYNL